MPKSISIYYSVIAVKHKKGYVTSFQIKEGEMCALGRSHQTDMRKGTVATAAKGHGTQTIDSKLTENDN